MWHAEVGSDVTTIKANFHGVDPNSELVEINVRRSVFSPTEHHIYSIATKREFYGYEIAGIKLHAAIDVRIEHNRIHDCSLGTWLDWQTQGRISRNLYYRNCRDLFVEVSHGPYLVDHNIFASPASLELFSQGGAFVHNLVAGAEPYEHEAEPQVLDGPARVAVTEEADAVYFDLELPSGFDRLDVGVLGGADLEPVRFVGIGYEETDGSPARLDLDLIGTRRERGTVGRPGPLATAGSKASRLRIW